MLNFSRLLDYDYKLSKSISEWIDYDSVIRKVVQIFTVSGTFVFWAPILLIYYFMNETNRSAIYSIAFVTIIMLGIVYVIKHVVKRSRPEYKDTRLGVVALDAWSFPSGHATRATYMVILMSIYFPEWSILWFIWGFLICLSRLLLGVHYLTDILAGIIITSTIILVMFSINWLPTAPFWNIIS